MKKTTKPTIVTAILAVVTLSACQTTSAPDRFTRADVNKDGKVSRDEASDCYVTDLFKSRDANGDKKVTWAEWNVPGTGVDKAKFAARDTDKDGAVSLDEAKTYAQKHGVVQKPFAKADTNKDGYLSRDEANAYVASKEGPAN